LIALLCALFIRRTLPILLLIIAIQELLQFSLNNIRCHVRLLSLAPQAAESEPVGEIFLIVIIFLLRESPFLSTLREGQYQADVFLYFWALLELFLKLLLYRFFLLLSFNSCEDYQIFPKYEGLLIEVQCDLIFNGPQVHKNLGENMHFKVVQSMKVDDI
jgi:hypothetical protein